MVAMFSFIYTATEPFLNNCFSPNNGGYEYLLFPYHHHSPSAPSATTETIPNASEMGMASAAHLHNVCGCQETLHNDGDNAQKETAAAFNNRVLVSNQQPSVSANSNIPRDANCDRIDGRTMMNKRWQQQQQQLHHNNNNGQQYSKAASEPPQQNCSVKRNKGVASRRYNSFHKSNTVRSVDLPPASVTASGMTRSNSQCSRIGRKISSKSNKLMCGLSESNNNSNNKSTASNGIGRFLIHFFESLNPLNGFKDREEFEEYLYSQSYKIEPKTGEMPNPKPKHPPEALKSPGVKPQKSSSIGTAPSGGGSTAAATISSLRTPKGSMKSSISSPRTPNPLLLGSLTGNLLSPSHINVPAPWNSPAAFGYSSSANDSPTSHHLAGSDAEQQQNFAIVDINPGQFPRWLADTGTSGRINPAFISEYAHSSTLFPAYQATHYSDESPTSPPAPMHSGGSSTKQQQQPSASSLMHRRPPVPLCSNESHFTFPPPLFHQQQPHSNQFGGGEQQHIGGGSALSTTAPGGGGTIGIGRRKPPAPPPPQTNQQLQHQSSVGEDSQQQQQQTHHQHAHHHQQQQSPSFLSPPPLPPFPLAKPPITRRKLPAANPPQSAGATTPNTTTTTITETAAAMLAAASSLQQQGGESGEGSPMMESVPSLPPKLPPRMSNTGARLAAPIVSMPETTALSPTNTTSATTTTQMTGDGTEEEATAPPRPAAPALQQQAAITTGTTTTTGGSQVVEATVPPRPPKKKSPAVA